MSKYYTMPRSKGASRKRKKKRIGLYAKSTRPFAPEYSTSTISKAINLVYGAPELPNNPRAWDVPGTTHFNIFHRSGVSNGNDVLGQVTSDEYRVHPNNHRADDSGASSTMGVDPDDVFDAMRDGQERERRPANVEVVQEARPITTLDLGKAPAEDLRATLRDIQHMRATLQDILKNNGASTSGGNNPDDDDIISDDEDVDAAVGRKEHWTAYNNPTFGTEPIGNDGNRESQNIEDVIDDVVANTDSTLNSQMYMNQSMTSRPQGEIPAGTSAVQEAFNEAMGDPLPANPMLLRQKAVIDPTLVRRAINTPLPDIENFKRGHTKTKIRQKNKEIVNARRYNTRSSALAAKRYGMQE